MDNLIWFLRLIRLLSQFVFSIVMVFMCIIAIFKRIMDVENEKIKVGLATVTILLIIVGATIFLSLL